VCFRLFLRKTCGAEQDQQETNNPLFHESKYTIENKNCIKKLSLAGIQIIITYEHAQTYSFGLG